MAEPQRQPAIRREPGIIGKLLSRLIGLVFWVFVSLLLSIMIEWIGIAWFWPEQGFQHSQMMLETEYGYLNDRVIEGGSQASYTIYSIVNRANQWLMDDSGLMELLATFGTSAGYGDNQYINWLRSLYQRYQHYVMAIPYMTQLFFVRIAVIIFSLPAFVLFGLVGLVDGLVERDLRKWGAGRESSNVYNIARKTVFPVFISACVLYISLPVSLHPAWVIMPFAVIFGFTVRVTFERLKKYF